MNKKILIQAILLITLLAIPIPFSIFFNLDIFFIKAYVMAIAAYKTFFFIIKMVKQEIDLIKIEEFNQNKYILLVCFSMFIIILSYGLDFFVVQLIDNKSFTGIPIDTPWYKLLFKMFYYSALFFFWLGVSNILPNSTTTEFITLVKSLVTFFTLYYGTLNFVAINKEHKTTD